MYYTEYGHEAETTVLKHFSGSALCTSYSKLTESVK